MHVLRFGRLTAAHRGWWCGRPLVLRLYNETILSVLGGATKLIFSNSGWQPRDGVNFARVLPLCANLEILVLVSNFIGDEGCTAIAEAVGQGALPKLKALRITNNEIKDAGCRALAAAMRAGALPALTAMGFHHDYAGMRNLAGDEARAELREACKARGVESIHC